MDCCRCGRHRRIRLFVDSYQEYGATGPENLDPLDEQYVCKACWRLFKLEWLKRFKQGNMHGDYRKSDAERQAAKERKLVWVSSGTDWPGNYKQQPFNIYVTRKAWLLNQLTKKDHA